MKKAESKLNTIYKKYWLNIDGYQSTHFIQLMKINGILYLSKSGKTMYGVPGISKNPKHDGHWTGDCWSNFSIELTEAGVEKMLQLRQHGYHTSLIGNDFNLFTK